MSTHDQASILAAARANASSLSAQRNGHETSAPRFTSDPPADVAALASMLSGMQRNAADAAILASETRMRQLVDERTAEIAARVQAQATVNPDELRACARDVLLGEIGKAGAIDAALSGAAPVLPALLPMDPDYVRTSTGERIARALKRGRRFILVSGPSGSGKTFPAEQECRALSRRAIKLPCGDGVTRADLIARQTASAGSTGWQEGVLPLCMRHGLVLILDEMDKLDPLVLAALNSALEREPSLLLPWGEQLLPAPGFCVIGTCNGLTDETGLYTTHTMSADLPNRAAGALVHADYLEATRECDILVRRTRVDAGKAGKIVSALGTLRSLMLKGALDAAPSLRVGLAVAEEITGPDPVASDVAWSVALLDGLKPTQRKSAQVAIANAGAWNL